LFPHHENEIAQSRSVFHTPLMARTWMHNGFLQVEGEKMAKSAGNFVTIHELLTDWPGEVLRLNMLRTHYRQPIDWTEAGMTEAERTLDQWYALTPTLAPGTPSASMLEALCDDLNTPRALAVLHDLRQDAAKGDKKAAADLKASAQLIGLMQMESAGWAARRRSSLAIDDARIESLIEARNAARGTKNFAEADRIRDELTAMGVELEDNKDGTTTWKVKR
jgi:cysteinyl-tRNA synthetase